jgi:hypothetical protein
MTTDQLIHATAEAWGDEKPRAALIHVTLTGDRLFSGRAAFEKAVELRRLVLALGERDIPDSAVALTGATLDVSTGLFTRSSSVTYRVRIRLDEIDRLPDALDAIAECKQARLSHLEWDYAASASDELLADCATRAMAKAKRLASALGVTLAGLHSVHEEHIADVQPYPQMMASYEAMAGVATRRSRVAGELEGLELAPTKKVGVRVKIAYAITR